MSRSKTEYYDLFGGDQLLADIARRDEEEVIPPQFDPDCISVEPVEAPAKLGPVVVKRKREGIQLCKVYDPAKPPKKWNTVIYEPKFDGYRCIALVRDGKAELLTSTGLPHNNVDHIKLQLERAAEIAPSFCNNVMYDGEVMHEDLPFDVAGGILRKSTEKDPRSEGFIFHVWDWMYTNEFEAKACALKLSERKMGVRLAVEAATKCGSSIVEVKYREAKLDQAVAIAREFVLQDGNEGIVLKDAKGLYEFRKSGVWLKWKPKFDGENVSDMKEGDLRIEGAIEGRGKHKGRLGAILVYGFLQDDGNISPDAPTEGAQPTITGKAGTGFNDEQRERFWTWHQEGKLVGKVVEVRYQELSKDGSLRFPVFYRLREDKS